MGIPDNQMMLSFQSKAPILNKCIVNCLLGISSNCHSSVSSQLLNLCGVANTEVRSHIGVCTTAHFSEMNTVDPGWLSLVPGQNHPKFTLAKASGLGLILNAGT